VLIDDTNTLTWAISRQPVHPIDDDERDRIRSGIGVHPRLIPGTFRPEFNPESAYLQNRELQASGASRLLTGARTRRTRAALRSCAASSVIRSR
jgi:hypothetical protein